MALFHKATLVYALVLLFVFFIDKYTMSFVAPIYSAFLYVVYFKRDIWSTNRKNILFFDMAIFTWIIFDLILTPFISTFPLVDQSLWMAVSAYILVYSLFIINMISNFFNLFLKFGKLRYITMNVLFILVSFIVLHPFLNKEFSLDSIDTFQYILFFVGAILMLAYVSLLGAYFFRIRPVYEHTEDYDFLYLAMLFYFMGSFLGFVRIIFVDQFFTADILYFLETAFLSMFPVFAFYRFNLPTFMVLEPKFVGVNLNSKIGFFEFVPMFVVGFVIVLTYVFDVLPKSNLIFIMFVVFLYLHMDLSFYAKSLKNQVLEKEYRVNLETERMVVEQAEKLIAVKKELSTLINIDRLTMLHTLDYLYHISPRILNAEREEFSLLLINVDGFKNINNMYGNEYGDELLIEIAMRLKREFGDEMYVLRIGGDLFALGCKTSSYDNLNLIYAHVIEILSQPYKVNGRYMNVSFNCGCARFPQDALNIEELLQMSNIALLEAKRLRHTKRLVYYYSALGFNIFSRNLLEQQIKNIDFEREMLIYYTPQIDVSNESMVALTVDLNWGNTKFKNFTAEDVMVFAEQTGVITKLMNWYINKLANDIAPRIYEGFRVERISIRLLQSSMDLVKLLPLSIQVFKDKQLPTSMLEFEIHNDELSRHYYEHPELLQDIKEKGIGLSLSEFGVGFASLAHIKNTGVYKVVISDSVVESLDLDERDLLVVKSIITVAKGMGFKVLCNGVNRISQYLIVKDFGCDLISGDYVAEQQTSRQFWQKYFSNAEVEADHVA